ncbi:hypothetical protein [Cryobacterium psychrophilum]|uniref:Type IV toxin-antitoxin system AbiEi family antitoxin domain-containing protein n=1 Tax=Cryobacterium psychrophilum TaxID=41988 RepID=A0A4Y8KTD6_9MICO|nr:hypothetical protein [Cryobacterium psychrophilum]TDW28988.1 hypothetical protein EDD25_0663 [Cryobacterium psychrophilum]TFD79792.1 hypothetical protein E3T53_07210 [Cryobacterium psychrophilum]
MLEMLKTYGVIFGGLIPTQALRDSGLSSHAVDALRQRAELVRVRRGWYALGASWEAMGADKRYRLVVRATAHQAGPQLVLSHHSAAVLHNLPLIGSWPSAVHALRPDSAGGSSQRLLTAHRGMPDPHQILIGGVNVTSLPRTLIDMAADSSFLVGVTMIDHVLNRETVRVAWEQHAGVRGPPPITKEMLFTELEEVRPRAGRRAAERAIAFANGLSANEGESLSRVRFAELGFEVPELQVRFEVRGHTYFVDYYWRGVRKIGEFDGDIKYTRAEVMNGRDIVGVIMAEKERENLLRPLVNSLDRWGWRLAFNATEFYRFLTKKDVPRAHGQRAL